MRSRRVAAIGAFLLLVLGLVYMAVDAGRGLAGTVVLWLVLWATLAHYEPEGDE